MYKAVDTNRAPTATDSRAVNRRGDIGNLIGHDLLPNSLNKSPDWGFSLLEICLNSEIPTSIPRASPLNTSRLYSQPEAITVVNGKANIIISINKRILLRSSPSK